MKPWEELNEYGEGPGDICCQRSVGHICHTHDPKTYETGVRSDIDVQSNDDLLDLILELAARVCVLERSPKGGA